MNETRTLVSELLRLGSCFARDKLVSKGPHRHLRDHICCYQSCLESNEFSDGELCSLSKEIYGVAKMYEQNHPELNKRYPEFFRILDEVREHIHLSQGQVSLRGPEQAVA